MSSVPVLSQHDFHRHAVMQDRSLRVRLSPRNVLATALRRSTQMYSNARALEDRGRQHLKRRSIPMRRTQRKRRAIGTTTRSLDDDRLAGPILAHRPIQQRKLTLRLDSRQDAILANPVRHIAHHLRRQAELWCAASSRSNNRSAAFVAGYGVCDKGARSPR